MKPWKVLPFIALIISISGFNLTRYSELPPSYPNGHNALIEFISDNLKYPEEAVTNDIEDKVFIEFHVDTDGSITDLKSIKGIGFGCNKESERVMRLSKMESRIQGWNRCESQNDIAFHFKLSEKK